MDTESQNVTIIGIKIPFMSLVGFMIKATIASIPALILFILMMVGLQIGFGILVEMFELQDMLSFMQQR